MASQRYWIFDIAGEVVDAGKSPAKTKIGYMANTCAIAPRPTHETR